MDLKSFIKKIPNEKSPARKIAGIILIIIGFLALITPFTPGSWLALMGLELLGLGFLIPKRFRKVWDKWKESVLGRFGL